MFIFVMNSMILFLSLMFLFSSHPLLLGMITILMTISITLIIGVLLSSFWISYILFLIYLGAVLVLFIYMISLSPNEIFPNIKIFYIMIVFIMTMFILNFNYSIYEKINFPLELKFSKLFSSSMFLLTIMLMIFLLFTLFSIMKITKFYSGPLRLTFN